MAGVYEPGSCDESDEDSGSEKTTPPYSNPPSTDTSERELAPAGRGRGRGGGRAMVFEFFFVSNKPGPAHSAPVAQVSLS